MVDGVIQQFRWEMWRWTRRRFDAQGSSIIQRQFFSVFVLPSISYIASRFLELCWKERHIESVIRRIAACLEKKRRSFRFRREAPVLIHAILRCVQSVISSPKHADANLGIIPQLQVINAMLCESPQDSRGIAQDQT